MSIEGKGVTEITKPVPIVLPRILSTLSSSASQLDQSFRDQDKDSLPPLSNEEQDTPLINHLVIHLDVNETVLVCDDAGGDSRDAIVNKMLAKSAFVQYPSGLNMNAVSTFEPTVWWDGTPIRDSRENDQLLSLPPPLYTGWDWPHLCCPYYRTQFKNRARNFVESHGSMYRSLYDVIHEKLGSECDDSILLALFETLKELVQRKVSHSIVFRTFGTDLETIASAVTRFALGQHPLYPFFYNPQYILDKSHLYIGRWVLVNNDSGGKLQSTRQQESPNTASTAATNSNYSRDFVNDLAETKYEYQLSQPGAGIVAKGDDKVLQLLQSKLICGIQDDYMFWNANDCAPWAGKPVWKTEKSATIQYHHVLFDDNIHNSTTDSIAAVRAKIPNQNSYMTLSGSNSLLEHGIHLIRVPTIEPVMNPRWFITQLDQAQERYKNESKIDV